MQEVGYPRVLIAYNSKINESDSHGVSIRSWFSNWPKEHLAQIYTGGEIGNNAFCSRNYLIGAKDRRFGSFFKFVKHSSIASKASPITLNENSEKRPHKVRKVDVFINKSIEFLINTGVWELIFKPRLSDNLSLFVKEFSPHIIYCQGYNITFSILPLLISRKFNIPICFQTGDDWPYNRYSDGFFSFFMSPYVRSISRKLILSSDVRLANGEKMARVYKERYGVDFEVVMMCDSFERFRNSPVYQLNQDQNVFSICYTGNLGGKRWESLLDLKKAIEILINEGLNIKIFVLTNNVPLEALLNLKESDCLQILPDASHEDLPSYLKGADLLFLPESFNENEANRIHLSISTKAHLYMFSEKPIIVYAHRNTGIVDYAITENWATVITERDTNLLVKAIRETFLNDKLTQGFIDRSNEVVKKNHESENVHRIFFNALSKCINI